MPVLVHKQNNLAIANASRVLSTSEKHYSVILIANVYAFEQFCQYLWSWHFLQFLVILYCNGYQSRNGRNAVPLGYCLSRIWFQYQHCKVTLKHKINTDTFSCLAPASVDSSCAVTLTTYQFSDAAAAQQTDRLFQHTLEHVYMWPALRKGSNSFSKFLTSMIHISSGFQAVSFILHQTIVLYVRGKLGPSFNVVLNSQVKLWAYKCVRLGSAIRPLFAEPVTYSNYTP